MAFYILHLYPVSAPYLLEKARGEDYNSNNKVAETLLFMVLI